MIRSALSAVACLALAGCITNTSTQSTQSGQLLSAGNQTQPVRSAPAPQQQRPLSPTAQMAAARLITFSKATTSGAALILASPASLTPDCKPVGAVEAKVVSPPEHGTIQIVKGTAFPNFVPGDLQFACNARRSPATVITYRSAPGFTGDDTASVQIFFPDGQAPTLLARITVR